MSTTLSDDEVSSLFTLESSPPKPIEDSFPPTEELIPEGVPEVKEGITLSDEEITTLFRKKPESEPLMEKSPQIEVVTEPSPSEEEWEVDSFGRLLRKEKEPEVRIRDSELSIKDRADTPDISSLESKFEKPEPSIVKPTLLKDLQVEPDIDSIAKKQLQNLPDVESLEKALVDTESVITDKDLERDKPSLFDQEVTSPITSIVDSLTEDESVESKDIFGVPEVSYEEISSSEEPSKADVKPPDLIDLFSDALSELGSIGGESGEGSKDKKKKK